MGTLARLIGLLVLLAYCSTSIWQPGPSSLLQVGFFVSAVLLYFFPLIEAKVRESRQSTAIGILVLFTGWTVIGWIAALIWAVIKSAPLPATPAQPERQEWLTSERPIRVDADDTRPCPLCAEPIKKAAIVCKHCGRDVPAAA